MFQVLAVSKPDRFMCFVVGVGPHHPFQFGTVRRLSDDVVLRGGDAQEVQVLGARGAACGFLRLIAVQHPNLIMAQQRVVCRNKHTHKTTRQLELDEAIMSTKKTGLIMCETAKSCSPTHVCKCKEPGKYLEINGLF